MKICTKCNIKKSLEEFGNNKLIPDGKAVHCKSCKNQYYKQYYNNNKDVCVERITKWQAEHPEKNKEYCIKYYYKG